MKASTLLQLCTNQHLQQIQRKGHLSVYKSLNSLFASNAQMCTYVMHADVQS